MTTFSKYFDEQIGLRSCQDFLHPETCGKHFQKDILLYTLSNFKYFAAICLLPALVKIKTMELRKILEYYFNCSVTGASAGLSINLFICLIRKIYGHFHYYGFVFIPSIIGVFPVYMASARVRYLFETAVFQCIIDTFFRMRKNILSRTIANSKILQTCIFMACSSIVLHVKRMYGDQGFWLLSPNPTLRLMDYVEQCSKCNLHPQISCKKYVANGLRKYFILGLSMDLIKMLINPVATVRNQSKSIGKLKTFRIRSMALLAAYIGIYRFAHCWFNRLGFYSDSHNHIISSFLAGSCYCLYPQTSLLAFALMQAIRSSWKCFEVKYNEGENKALRLILALPSAKILYTFALATLIHLTVMHPKYASPFAVGIVNGISNNYAMHLQNEVNLLKERFQFERSN